ncbi:MAG: hypothetical protein KDC10_13250 [Calditrichaeota bacterium]|nr:hypothetical protein [Calditrichota bacterium]
MQASSTVAERRLGAYTAILGSICAMSGAALMLVSGADIDLAIADDQVGAYLMAAGEHKGLLVANLTVWMVMAFLLGIAATAMTSLSGKHRVWSVLARYCYWTGVPLVLAAYVGWLAVVVQVAPDTSPPAILLAETMGWFAPRADWVATILIIGIGPTFISLAGREDWVPKWLLLWSFVTAASAALNAVAMLTGGAGLATYGFAIIPVGVGWRIVAGIVLARGAVAHSPSTDAP